MKATIQFSLATVFAALTLAATGAQAASPSKLVSKLCWQVAANGDENGTDSRESYAETCVSDNAGAASFADAAQSICDAAPQYSSDIEEATGAAKAKLSKELKRQCLKDAKALGA